jgi:hypothetical protein
MKVLEDIRQALNIEEYNYREVIEELLPILLNTTKRFLEDFEKYFNSVDMIISDTAYAFNYLHAVKMVLEIHIKELTK